MPPDVYEPSDAVALRMENDLLTAENDVLRARLAEAERQASALERKLEKDDDGGPAPVSDPELEELQHARSDLRWFVQRLSRSPMGPFLRRWAGFRVLEERWLP